VKISLKRRPPLRLCALVVLSAGLLFPTGAARATTPTPGSPVAWGCGANLGQCNVPSGLSGVTAVAGDEAQSLALKQDGTVVAWGCSPGDFGQCSVPNGLSGVTAIAAGVFHSLALKSDGSVVAWGCAPPGEDVGQCTGPSGLSGASAIAAGYYHSLAVRSDGSVAAWGCAGYRDYGQCSVPNGLSGVTAVAAGHTDSLALKSDGSVVAWGCLTDEGLCDVPSGLSGVTAISAGFAHSLALKSDGTVVAWGCNGGTDVGQCDVPNNLSGVTAIAAGWYQSLALKSDGTVVAWGCAAQTDWGQCNVPSGLSGVTAIAGGEFHSLAVAPANQSPDCSAVRTTPSELGQMRDQLALITLAGATDPDGDALSYHIVGVSQDEYVTGLGDDTSPDAALTAAGADSNQVLLRSEANPRFNGRVYRIAYTVSDGQGGSCSGTAGPSGTTTAKVSVPRKKGTSAVDDGDVSSWNSFTGAPVQ
jgi:hypothetical protein